MGKADPVPEREIDLNLRSYRGSTSDDRDIAVVVAVAIVLMMQVAIDKVIHVVAVRHRRVSAIRTMNMVRRMPAARMPTCA